MNRRDMLKLTLSGVAGLAGVAAARAAEPAAPASAPVAPPVRRPNVILILADDLGYETLGCNGGTSYKTPVLDRLASEGARFDACYAQPLCTPTRVQLMTGIYNVRNYVRFGEMDRGAVTFAHLLKQAGYATCIAGKWQLGHNPDLPRTFGFDEHCLWQHTHRPPRYANPGLEINGQRKEYSGGEYGPDIVNDYAMDFISRNKGGPFFLYYPMMLTHDPYQPTPDSRDYDPKARGEAVNQHPRHFGEMVAYMDKLIGKLVARLDELKLRENTLLLFLGDNGTGKGMVSQMGERTVRGGKGSTCAAGMHVPLVASWPGTIRPGTVCKDLVDTTDFLPTICQAAGAAVPEKLAIDGRSFLPALQGRAHEPRPWIYCWYSRGGESAKADEFAFNHRHKLTRAGELIDIQNDPAWNKPIPPGQRSAQAQADAKLLQAALDR